MSHAAKVFERLVQRRITEHVQRLGFLIPKQFGFREGHSSAYQLMRLVEFISGAGCSGEETVAFFLDVEQAFEGLLHKHKAYSGLLHTSDC